MLDLIFSDKASVFLVFLILVLIISIVEFVSGTIGSFLDSLLPEFDLDADSNFTLLGFLGIGRVPILIWMTLLFLIFSLTGLAIVSVFGLSQYIVIGPALIIALIANKILSGLLERILPKDETTAEYSNSFVGSSAIIISEKVRKGYKGQARFTDKHGQSHYVMVEPFEDNVEYIKNDTVTLVEFNESYFTVTK